MVQLKLNSCVKCKNVTSHVLKLVDTLVSQPNFRLFNNEYFFPTSANKSLRLPVI